MNVQISASPSQISLDVAAFDFTFGPHPHSTIWSDVRSLTWAELGTVLTRHEVGAKEGSCIVPAVFSGVRRHKSEATRIDVAFLDSDSGATLTEITGALAQRGWAAVVSSTHSHMATTTRVRRRNWDKFREGGDLADAAKEIPGAGEGLSAADRGRRPPAARGRGVRCLRAPALPEVPGRHPAAAALGGRRLRGPAAGQRRLEGAHRGAGGRPRPPPRSGLHRHLPALLPPAPAC